MTSASSGNNQPSMAFFNAMANGDTTKLEEFGTLSRTLSEQTDSANDPEQLQQFNMKRKLYFSPGKYLISS